MDKADTIESGTWLRMRASKRMRRQEQSQQQQQQQQRQHNRLLFSGQIESSSKVQRIDSNNQHTTSQPTIRLQPTGNEASEQVRWFSHRAGSSNQEQLDSSIRRPNDFSIINEKLCCGGRNMKPEDEDCVVVNNGKVLVNEMKTSSNRGRFDLHLASKSSSNNLLLTTITKTMSSSESSILFSISILLLLVTLLPSVQISSAYQLTNNIIANNAPPKFLSTQAGQSANSEIVIRVKEGPSSIGKLIYTLKAEDPDEDQVTFGVMGSMASELLRIENVPGNQANVYLRKELDRETAESHQVILTLSDGKLGRGNWVEDVNDNYPVFSPHRTAISIREDSKVPLIIETLEATDQDEGRFGQVIYKLDELGMADADSASGSSTNPPLSRASYSAKFAIETIDGKGVLSLISPLDYEQKHMYQLRVIAIDRAIEHERLSATTNILITVEDCEDQAPMFTYVPSITRIPENLPIGSAIVRLTAVDGDRGLNNPIQYKLLSVNGVESGYDRNLFALDPTSGQVSVARPLDRESASGELALASGRQESSIQAGTYVLKVRATETSGSSSNSADNSVTTEFTIILTDVNDERPKFNLAHYYGELLENSPSESVVSLIEPMNQPNSLVYSETLGGGQVSIAKVVDRDQGTNGTFTLHLEGEHSQLFEIWPREATNEANFMIKVAGSVDSSSEKLDYERTKQFHFTIVAREKFLAESEGSQQSNSAQMTVFLKDSNDNYPQFASEVYRVEVPENAIRGMHICAVKATDSDSGIYGSAGIRYTEIRGEKANKFRLDPTSGIVTLKTSEHGFDRETMAQHHLIIEARDNNGTGNRNTTQLLIVLTDVNDQRPKFPLDQYEAFIFENELDFQSPLQVQATDNDARNTPNSRLTYSIVAGDPHHNFTIDPNTGRIRVKNSLIVGPGRNSPPEVTGSDSEILMGEADGSVALVAGGLDFERIAQKRDDTRQFNLTVRATDAGIPEPMWSTTQVIIIVYDKNDHAPVFTRNVYTKSLREDAKEGSQVIQVLAHDGDHSPTHSKITYRISSGGGDKFVIDSDSGLISVANGANLDIDRAVGGQRRQNYLLNVIASDGSFGPNQKSASALVNITIIDVNNKPPEFISLGASRSVQAAVASTSNQLAPQSQPPQLMVVHVNEDAPYGLIVTRVIATDLDSNAELRYSINWARSEARNEETALVDPQIIKDLFTIEPTDGTIKVAKPLDRELFDQVKLSLQVEDIAAQTPDQIALSFLLIRITDVNDNRPQFRKPIFKAVVNENSISGTSVITLTADDRDLNKTLRYSLEGEPEMMRLVRINPRSGEITVNDKIDRELFPLINVTVRAEDFGFPHSLTGSTLLLITVRDENDNNPIFMNGTQMRHRSDAGFSVPDTSSQSPRNHHHTNDTTSANNGYRLRSLARSGGEEDRLPLLSPGSSAKVREDAAIGHEIAYVRAEDADVGNNGRVTYLMDAQSSGGKFRIDRDSGIISVASSLDREDSRQYTLNIEACDNYDLGYSTGESRRAFAQVNIQILDINDNVPVISTNLQSATSLSTPTIGSHPSVEDIMQSSGPYQVPMAECLFINEFQALNEPILTIRATDADDPATPNGQVDLSIVNNLSQNEFFALVMVPKRAEATPTIPSIVGLAPDQPLGATNETDLSGFGEESASTSAPPLNSGQRFRVNPSRQPRHKRQTNSVSAQKARSKNDDEEDLMFAASSDTPEMHPVNRQWRSSFANYISSRSSPTPTTSTPTIEANTPTELPTEAVGSYISATSSSVLAGSRSQNPSEAATSSISSFGERQAYIVVSQSLKERVGNYSILIRATDRGQPALFSVKQVNICVQDVNNHAPIFNRPPLNHTIRIMENATIGTFVTQVEASDADQGQNSELQYSLKATNIQNNNNDWQSFKIDRQSGVISTAKEFNRQIKKHYTLRVQAQDLGKPTSLSSDIDINIMIVNSGSYQPEFENQLQTLVFTENVAAGVEWYILTSTTNLDDDPALINVNSAIATSSSQSSASNNNRNWLASPCYFIIDGDDQEQVFHLDRYTRRLTSQRAIDREKKANYTLIVKATDNCSKVPPYLPATRHLVEPAITSGSQPEAHTFSSLGIDYRGATSDGQDSMTGSQSELNFQKVRLQRSTANRDRKSIEHQSPRVDNATTNYQPLIAGATKGFDMAAADAMIAADKSLLKVQIKIKDINDNAPKFTQKVYTGGITTEADFGTVFMIVQAIDLDFEANSQVLYSIVKPIKKNLSIGDENGGGNSFAKLMDNNTTISTTTSTTATTQRKKRAANPVISTQLGKQNPGMTTANSLRSLAPIDSDNTIAESTDVSDSEDLFVIHPQTGEISLNFDPQKHMKGYFEFSILANDSGGLFDSAKVFIYLLRQDQRVKFVLRLTPQELRQRLNKFRSVFGNITGAIVNIDSYKYFENHDGTVDKKKTSLYLHFVNPEDNTIIDVDKVLTLIDRNIEYLDELYKEFHVLSSEAAHLPISSSALVDPIDQIRTGLLGVASFLALILILVIALCLNQRTRYERQLKAATVSAFGASPLQLNPDFHSQTNLPNTNLHSQDPNPMYVNGFCDQDWIHGATGKGLRGNGSAGNHLHGASDDLDRLSSEHSDLSSLNGVNSVGQLHFNVASTATPRDSLNSSHGQVSTSGSGSSSTTNERHALCRTDKQQIDKTSNNKVQLNLRAEVHNSNSNNNNHQRISSPVNNNNNHSIAADQTEMMAGSRRKRSHLVNNTYGDNGGGSRSFGHSTFGSYKEVNIFTEPQPQLIGSIQQQQQLKKQQQQQHPTATNLIRTANKTLNQDKILTQIGKTSDQQKHYATSGQHQQRMLIHANGSDVNQGIVQITSAGVRPQQQQQYLAENGNNNAKSAGLKGILINGAVGGNPTSLVTSKNNIKGHQSLHQQATSSDEETNQAVKNFESGLVQLSIMKLETTEL